MSSRFSAVLLAGGRSTRMGRDKAFIEINRVPLWRRQLQVLAELEPEELFMAGPEHDEWQDANCVIIPDAEAGAGPLAGVVAALRRCSAPLLLTIAVDLPNLTSGYLRKLVAACSESCGVVPQDAQRFEPLVAVYPLRALAIAERSLATRELSLQRFAARCLAERFANVKDVTTEERRLFLNMNTREDLAAAAADASHNGHKGSARETASSSTL